MRQQSVRLFDVTPTLGRMLIRPGGEIRDVAICRAESQIADLREYFYEALGREISSLARLSDVDFCERHFDQISMRGQTIFNLAGAYGFTSLMNVAASLLDLVELMRRQETFSRAPIRVHIQAAILFAPGALKLKIDEEKHLLRELARVTASQKNSDQASIVL